jgi:phage-related protein
VPKTQAAEGLATFYGFVRSLSKESSVSRVGFVTTAASSVTTRGSAKKRLKKRHTRLGPEGSRGSQGVAVGNLRVSSRVMAISVAHPPAPASHIDRVYQCWYTVPMAPAGHEHDRRRPILEVVFFRTEAGNEPVREWLRGLVREDRRTVGEDIKTAQFGWPLGMPLIRKLATGLWEVRSHVSTGIARVMFTVDGQTMVLLHGFQKKSQRTPPADLMTAKRRLTQLRSD